METIYKTNTISPFQIKKESFNYPRKTQPIQDEIKKHIGTLKITASFSNDAQFSEKFSHVPGFVAFLCKLTINDELVGCGRGTAVLSRVNRFVERTLLSAKNASLIDAVVQSTKILDVIYLKQNPQNGTTLDEAYQINSTEQTIPITDKQKSYLLELFRTKISDPTERSREESQVDKLTKEEASAKISHFLYGI